MVIKAKKAVFVFAHLYNAYNAIMLHTLIMFIWTLLWKKAQSWGPISSHALAMFCSLSSSSNVVLA